ncbi:MAG: hypothetical protein ABSD02_01145 [Steroidobacteraceae bacterium]|jgi:hypothetical protein
MRKLASFALIAALGVSTVALSVPAEAGVVVGVGLPGVVVAPGVAPGVGYPAVGVYTAYYGRYYPHRFWYPGVRYGYGYYHHGGYRGRYWR